MPVKCVIENSLRGLEVNASPPKEKSFFCGQNHYLVACQVLTLDELPWVNMKTQPRVHYPVLK
jgi:hypothetical protein